MKIGSILENQKNEKRISITPDVIKKYISLGCEIVLSKNYGLHLGINDKEYSDEGAKLIEDDNEILKSSDLMVNGVSFPPRKVWIKTYGCQMNYHDTERMLHYLNLLW